MPAPQSPDTAPDRPAEGQQAEDGRRAEAVAAAAVRQAAAAGVVLPGDLRLWRLARRGPSLPDHEDGADGHSAASEHLELAQVLETVSSASLRRARGLHITPSWLADHLVGLALDGLGVDAGQLTICDPACGGGAFLLAAGRALHTRGIDQVEVVRHLLWGADVDPVGLATAEMALALWSGEAVPEGRLVVGDALREGQAMWPAAPRSGFAAVVGNPPFLNQLTRDTVRSREEAAWLRARFGAAVQAYTDTAWLFLLLGVELARPGGRVALVQPRSVAAARDAAGLRDAVDTVAELRQLWVEPRQSFTASVHVCAPILQVREAAQPSSPRTGQWAARLADALGVPAVDVESCSRLGDRAQVVAGFRDEYYGLVPLVREADGPDGERPLVTVGVLDWGRSAWGERTSRFAKRSWERPVVDVGRSDPADDSPPAQAATRWIERVTRPKIVVANQTRVVEAAVDETGSWVPSVPALAVLPDWAGRSAGAVDELWRLAAAVVSPTATAWLWRRAPGTALHTHALKIAARDLAELPLPVDHTAWDEAATALRAYAGTPTPATFDDFVTAAAAAYRASTALVSWWRSRFL
jgi:hypothetical protein